MAGEKRIWRAAKEAAARAAFHPRLALEEARLRRELRRRAQARAASRRYRASAS